MSKSVLLQASQNSFELPNMTGASEGACLSWMSRAAKERLQHTKDSGVAQQSSNAASQASSTTLQYLVKEAPLDTGFRGVVTRRTEDLMLLTKEGHSNIATLAARGATACDLHQYLHENAAEASISPVPCQARMVSSCLWNMSYSS